MEGVALKFRLAILDFLNEVPVWMPCSVPGSDLQNILFN